MFQHGNGFNLQSVFKLIAIISSDYYNTKEIVSLSIESSS